MNKIYDIVANIFWIILIVLLEVHNSAATVIAIPQNNSVSSQDSNNTNNNTLTVPTTGQEPPTTPTLHDANSKASDSPLPTFPWPSKTFNVFIEFVNLTQKLPLMVLEEIHKEGFRQLFADKMEVDLECISEDMQFMYGGKPMTISKRSAETPQDNDVTVQFYVSTNKFLNSEMLKQKINSSFPLKLFGQKLYPSIDVTEVSNGMQTSKPITTNLLKSNPVWNQTSDQLNDDIRKTQSSEPKSILKNISLQSTSQGNSNNNNNSNNNTTTKQEPPTTPSLHDTKTSSTFKKPVPNFQWPTKTFDVLIVFVNLTQKLPMMSLNKGHVEEFRRTFAEKLDIPLECVADANDFQFTYEGKSMKVNKRSAEKSLNDDVTIFFNITTDKYLNSEMLNEKLGMAPIELFKTKFYPSIFVSERNSTSEPSTSYFSISSRITHETRLQTLKSEFTSKQALNGILATYVSPRTSNSIFQTKIVTKDTHGLATKSSNDNNNNKSILSDGNSGGIILIYLLLLLLLIPVAISTALCLYCCLKTPRRKKPEIIHPIERQQTTNFYQPPLRSKPPSYRSNFWSTILSKMAFGESSVAGDNVQKEESNIYDNRDFSESRSSSYSRNSSLNVFQQDFEDNF